MAPSNRTPDSNPLDFIPRAEALRAAGQLAQAHNLCQQALTDHPHTAAGRNLHARILFDMGKYDLAEEECHAVLEVAPESVPARKLLVQIAIKRRRFVRAITLLDNLRTETGDDPDLLAAFIEAQRGLTERFYTDLDFEIGPRPSAKATTTRGELLEMMQRRPEVREARVVEGDKEGTALEEMLWTWGALCQATKLSPVRFSLIEGPDETILVRAMDDGSGAVVVRIKAGVPVGPCKRLAERVAQAGIGDESMQDSSEGVPVTAGPEQGRISS